MTNRVSKLVLAAVLLTSIPLAASADGRDRDRDGAPPAAGSGPAYPAYPAPPRPARDWREDREARAREGWRERREWRERERAEVSAQLRALDARRDRFYAGSRWRPGRARSFERWYAARRAELERRWLELQPVAWR